MIQHYAYRIQDAIQKELFVASKSVRLAVAWFTNNLLFQPLLMKLMQGVSVEIIINDDDINNGSGNELDFDLFLRSGGIIHWNKSNRLLHEKFCIIDDSIVIFGSYNWTNKAEFNDESITIASDEPNTLSFYQQRFNKLAQQYPATSNGNNIKNLSNTNSNTNKVGLTPTGNKVTEVTPPIDSRPRLFKGANTGDPYKIFGLHFYDSIEKIWEKEWCFFLSGPRHEKGFINWLLYPEFVEFAGLYYIAEVDQKKYLMSYKDMQPIYPHPILSVRFISVKNIVTRKGIAICHFNRRHVNSWTIEENLAESIEWLSSLLWIEIEESQQWCLFNLITRQVLCKCMAGPGHSLFSLYTTGRNMLCQNMEWKVVDANDNCKVIIPYFTDWRTVFIKENRIGASVKINGKFGIYYGGRLITPCEFDSIDSIFIEKNRIGAIVRNNGKFGIYYDGRLIAPCEYDRIDHKEGGFFNLYKNYSFRHSLRIIDNSKIECSLHEVR